MAASDLPQPVPPGGKILCVVGPTACGKTGIMTRLAERLPLEIISLDSCQIYRGLRIGTAQPTAAERRACPHHLIDFLSLDESYDAAGFREDFAAVHGDILARGGIPVLVGGAGFYLRALTHGFMDLPPLPGVDLADIRRRIADLSLPEVVAELQDSDPDSLARIHPHDGYRLRRALEIHRLTGRSMSDHMAQWQPRPCLDLDYLVVVLEPEVRQLEKRIRSRMTAMLSCGWVEETRAALDGYPAESPGLQCIGYPSIIRHLRGEISLGAAGEEIFLQTRQYAKRQRTWFRKIPALNRCRPGDPALSGILEQLLL